MDSVESWKEKYEEGWYPLYPEGDAIKFYDRHLKDKFRKKDSRIRLFDFGCANGTHAVFFGSKGFDTYGVDVIPDAIQACKHRLSHCKDNFKLISYGQDVERLFDVKFDVIFSRQVLYYLSDTDMRNTLMQFKNMLTDDGIVYFTMMGKECHYYKHAKPEKHDGLQDVTLSGRLNETTYINFVGSIEELNKKFDMFKPVSTGIYDLTIDGGSSQHYYFIGTK